MNVNDKTDLSISITWGLSSLLADIDNPSKPFIDCLQKKYGFNDRYIKELNLKKVKTDKGSEFIEFQITEIKSK